LKDAGSIPATSTKLVIARTHAEGRGAGGGVATVVVPLACDPNAIAAGCGMRKTGMSRPVPVILILAISASTSEVALTGTIARPLSAADFASIGAVVAQIEMLVVGLATGDTDAGAVADPLLSAPQGR